MGVKMLGEALPGLASAAGTGLVAAMAEDGWREVKVRAARLLGRGHANQIAQQEARLERVRQDLIVAATQGGAAQVRQAQETAWQIRFADLLEEQPGTVAQVQDLVNFLEEQVTSGATVQVDAQAFDQAYMSVQGQGVQNNAFGKRSDQK